MFSFLNHLQKKCMKCLLINFLQQIKDLTDNYFVHLFEDRTKMKITSEIQPPLLFQTNCMHPFCTEYYYYQVLLLKHPVSIVLIKVRWVVKLPTIKDKLEIFYKFLLSMSFKFEKTSTIVILFSLRQNDIEFCMPQSGNFTTVTTLTQTAQSYPYYYFLVGRCQMEMAKNGHIVWHQATILRRSIAHQHASFQKWYFVSKIVLTYCEKILLF